MPNDSTREHFQTQLNKLEEEKQALVKKQRLWEEYQNHWQYLLQEEQQLLEEVAYISQGTVSAAHAEAQLRNLKLKVVHQNGTLKSWRTAFLRKRNSSMTKKNT